MTNTEEKNTSRKTIQKAREEVLEIIRFTEERMETHNPSTRRRFSDGSLGAKMVNGEWVKLTTTDYFEQTREITTALLSVYKRIIPIYDHIVRNGGDTVDADFHWSLRTLLDETKEDVSERYKEFVTRCEIFFGTDDEEAVDKAMHILHRETSCVDGLTIHVNRTFIDPIRNDDPVIDLVASALANICKDETRSEDHTIDGMLRRGLIRFVENLQKTTSSSSSSIKSTII